MVEPKWDFQGGEDLEAAIDRYKTEAIPEFLDLIVKEAQTDDFQVRYTPLPSALSQYLICFPPIRLNTS